MEFKKKLIIYGSILGVLAVLFVLGSVVNLIGQTPAGEKVFPQLKTEAVEKITVTDKSGKLELAKEVGGWKVLFASKKFDAAKDAAESLFTNFTTMRKKNVVSTKKETWTNFSVDEANAVHIVLAAADGTPRADCYFGKGGSTSLSQYVRPAGSDDVIQSDVRIEKTTLLKDWVERRLFTADFFVEDVKQLAVKTSLVFNDQGQSLPRSLAFTLVPGEKNKDGAVTWTIRENEKLPIAPQKVSSLVSALAHFNADDVVLDPAGLKIDPAHPAGSVAVQLKSGTAYTLFLIGKSAADPNSYYVANQENKCVYVGSNWSLKGLSRGLRG